MFIRTSRATRCGSIYIKQANGYGYKSRSKDYSFAWIVYHRKQVWRSLGKLRAESHSTTAQKVFMNEHDTEVSTENADFIDGLKVTPYDGELPKISKYADCSQSHYQHCLRQNSI